MTWKDNTIVHWSSDNGSTWNKVTDHNREPLSISVERIEKKNRMVDGTLRRYTVGKKRTFQLSWNMIPSVRNGTYGGKTGLTTVDGGWAGEDIETFFRNNDGAFLMKIRKGSDENKNTNDASIEVVKVMFTDFSKEILKRGVVDFWSLNVTLEEV